MGGWRGRPRWPLGGTVYGVWSHFCLRGGSLASAYAVVGRRISGDYGEALLLPAEPEKGEFRLKKADRAGDAVDSPGVI
jgi:hypothetical protein